MVSSFVLLILGVAYNPSVSALFVPSPSYKAEYGFTNFDIPRFVDIGVPDTVYVNYTLGGVDFTEGQPLLLRVYLSINFNIEYRIIAIDVKPDNAFQLFVYKGQTYASIFPIPTDVGLIPHNDSRGGQVWSGSSLIEFAASGPFGATVNLFLTPNITFVQYLNRNHIVIQNNMHFHNETETITIEPSGQLQQLTYENENLSLTFFILFFASVDIGVTLYEHSYQQVKTREYAAS